MKLTDNLNTLKGIGPKKDETLKEHKMFTIEDLAYFFPRAYQDRRNVTPIGNLEDGKDALIVGTLASRRFNGRNYRGKSPLKLLIDDGNGRIEIVFFNGKYLSGYFKINEKYSFYGRPSVKNQIIQMIHPEFHKEGDLADIREILPVYPQIKGISQNEFRKLVRMIMPSFDQLEEWLPPEVVKSNKLAGLNFAIENMHFPKSSKDVLVSKFRLVFEELLVLEAGLLYMKNGEDNNSKGARINTRNMDDFINSFDFSLTEGQEKAWNDIASDISSEKKMNRLIQGDVGSGKTAVAEIAMYAAARSGYQSVMMVPTEILAKQHLSTLTETFENFGIKVALLCSSMKAAEKKDVIFKLKSGEIDILVGTHAIIQPGVEFFNLGLVITDEQHRFGVNQRKLLSQKGEEANVMVMTATPIPRTLAVILYGDLDISVIDSMPAGRKGIITSGARGEERKKVYEFVEKEIEEGHQAYVVAPLIDESDNIEARSAEELAEELKKKYKNHRVEVIHGAMRQEEKDTMMEEFLEGKIQVLVATVVIEVGINVPNATVMVIENSERFGLAQMHQLRGRVGRSEKQSYCFLICESESKVAKERMKIMCQSSDGFFIAEEDMKLRGPGEIFGTRQHGLPEMHVSDLIRHIDVLEKAKDTAREIFDKDPGLIKTENSELKRRIKKMFGEDIKLEL